VGQIRSAQGGTLLLDEVCELPLSVQPKLLRVLEQREVQPLGESRQRHRSGREVAVTVCRRCPRLNATQQDRAEGSAVFLFTGGNDIGYKNIIKVKTTAYIIFS
jgi:sigma54-dependent transcription regulator